MTDELDGFVTGPNEIVTTVPAVTAAVNEPVT